MKTNFMAEYWWPVRFSGHPSCPSAMTCRFFSVRIIASGILNRARKQDGARLRIADQKRERPVEDQRFYRAF